MVRRPVAIVVMNRFTIVHLPFSWRVLVNNHAGKGASLFLYLETLSQIAVLYAGIRQLLRINCEDIAQLTNNLVFLSKRMDNAEFTLDKIGTSQKLPKHRSVSLSWKLVGWLDEPFRHAIDNKVEIPTNGHWSSNFNSNFQTVIGYLPHCPFRTEPIFKHSHYYNSNAFYQRGGR